MKLLLIEDNPGDARLIEEMLAESRDASWEVECAATLSQGLERLESGGWDAVLLDLGLPDNRGLDTLRQAVSIGPNVPVVVLTGLKDERVGMEAIHEGAQDYLVKGRVDSELLSRSLAYAMERMWLVGRIKKSEGMYRTLTMTSPDAITLSDLEGNLVFASRRTLELHGYESPDELLGKSALQLIHPDEHKRAMDNLRVALEEGTVRDVVHTMLRKDGSTFAGELSASLIRDAQGDPEAFIAVTRDVTERKRARERTERLNRCFLNLGTDHMRNIEYLVEAGGEILGGACILYNRLEVDRNLLCTWAIWHEPEGYEREDDPEGHICYDLIARGGGGPVVIGDLEGTKYEKTDPNVIRYGLKSYLGCPVMLKGAVVGSYCLCDVRKREFAKEEIETLSMLAKAVSIEEERLAREEGLKDFIDIASHELRHPVTIMQGYAMSLKHLWEKLDEEQFWDMLEAIEHGAERMNNLVLELLDASSIERHRFFITRQRVDLALLAERTLSEMRQKVPGGEFSLSVPEDAGSCNLDAEKLQWALIILLDNAAKYSPANAEIEVTVEAGDEEVCISVLDRGPGVPEKEVEAIFARFHQVEDSIHHSSGIGLGLYIARAIVEAHGGRIWCEPREDGGSAFRLTLPRD